MSDEQLLVLFAILEGGQFAHWAFMKAKAALLHNDKKKEAQ